METLSVLPDGRIALCKMVHGTEITLVFQAKERPKTPTCSCTATR